MNKEYYGIPEDTPEWYETFIEKPIQPLVKLLRNNGFETCSSCGHEMNCICEYSMEGEIKRLYDLLLKNGYNHFVIEIEILGQYYAKIIIKVPKEEDKHKIGIETGELFRLSEELNYERDTLRIIGEKDKKGE